MKNINNKVITITYNGEYFIATFEDSNIASGTKRETTKKINMFILNSPGFSFEIKSCPEWERKFT